MISAVQTIQERIDRLQRERNERNLLARVTPLDTWMEQQRLEDRRRDELFARYVGWLQRNQIRFNHLEPTDTTGVDRGFWVAETHCGTLVVDEDGRHIEDESRYRLTPTFTLELVSEAIAVMVVMNSVAWPYED